MPKKDSAEELKILDVNLWMLPAPIASDQKKRLQRFILLVKRTSPDIIALQEVWLRKYVTFIRKNLKGYHIRPTDPGRFNKSGLLILSKKRPSAWHFQRFVKIKGENRVEKLAGKGYLMIKCPLLGRQFNIVSTHLYAQMRGNRKTLAEHQFKVLKRLTRQGDWIISGDLNIDKARFTQLNRGHFLSHIKNQFTVSSENRYARSRLNRFGKKDRILDYTLLRIDLSGIKLKTEVIKSPLISDHYAVLTTITSKKRGRK